MQADDKEQTTVGASLAAGREALGITQIEAADVLNLTQRTIAALETDDYENLPGWVYASGYIRAYARMLGLDADDLVKRSAASRQESAETLSQGEEATPASRHHVNKMPIQLTLRQWGYAALVLLGLVLFISVFDDIPRPEQKQPVAQQQPVNETPATASELVLLEDDDVSEPVNDNSVVAAVAAEATPEVIDNVTATETLQSTEIESLPVGGADEEAPLMVATELAQQDEGTETLLVPEEEVLIATAAVDASTEDAADSQVVNEYQVPYFGEDETGARKLSLEGDQRLRFEFAADCWIEIRDSANNLVYADLGRAGEVRRFVGTGPFALKLGFADGVQVFFDAEEVDLAPFTRNQMARLELGQ